MRALSLLVAKVAMLLHINLQYLRLGSIAATFHCQNSFLALLIQHHLRTSTFVDVLEERTHLGR